MTIAENSRFEAAAAKQAGPFLAPDTTFQAGRLGHFQFRISAAEARSKSPVFQRPGLLERACRSIGHIRGHADSPAQSAIRRALLDAGNAFCAVLAHVSQGAPDLAGLPALADTVQRMMSGIADVGRAGSYSVDIFGDIARVHLRHVGTPDLLVLRKQLNDLLFSGRHWTPPETRAPLLMLSAALREQFAWLATREPVRELANLCQTLRQGDLVHPDALLDQIRLLQAGVNMLRDRGSTAEGLPRDQAWRSDEAAQREDRTEFMVPAIRDLYDTSLAAMEHLLADETAQHRVACSLLDRACTQQERVAFQQTFEALGGAIRAEKAIRLQRRVRECTATLDDTLAGLYDRFRVVSDSPSLALYAGSGQIPADPHERAIQFLANLLAQALPGRMHDNAPPSAARMPVFVENAGIRRAAGRVGWISLDGREAATALESALDNASHDLSGAIARLGMVHGYQAESEAGLHDVMLLMALRNTRLWCRLVVPETEARRDSASMQETSSFAALSLPGHADARAEDGLVHGLP